MLGSWFIGFCVHWKGSRMFVKDATLWTRPWNCAWLTKYTWQLWYEEYQFTTSKLESLMDSCGGSPADGGCECECECECDEGEADDCETCAFASFAGDWRKECQPGRFGLDMGSEM